MVLRICHGFLVRQRRPVLCYREGLGASEVPFDCHHLAGPAAQGASARHPHSRTLVAVPAGSRPLIPSPGHGRHSGPRPRELLSGPRPWRQAPRRCPTAKGSHTILFPRDKKNQPRNFVQSLLWMIKLYHSIPRNIYSET